MTRRAAGRLAWTLAAVASVLAVGGLVFTILNWSTLPGSALDPVFETVFSLGLLAFPTVGALVASRRPENPIGWIFCAVGIPFGLSGFAYGYAAYSLFTDPGSLPATDVMAWVSAWLFLPPLFSMVPLLFLLFPDGRLLSRRWSVVAWLTAAGMVATATSTALFPGRLEEPPFEGVENPFGVETIEPVLDVASVFGWSAMLLAILASAVSLLIRLRNASGSEREQLKWVAAAAALFALACLAALATWRTDAEPLGQIAVLVAFSAIPVAAGVAILRYRLYDIDVVINRTLVYGTLTALLAATYLGLVLLFQLALGPLTQGNELGVAVSTLAVAALFRPVRRRIQNLVDRRFYRRKYDAERTLAAFSARLRDEVELETLAADLRAVVSETVQPAHVSLWLREAPR